MTAEDPLIVTIADAIVDADTLTGDLMPAARKVYEAIAATGRLLPDGGTTEIQHRYRDPDGFTMVGLAAVMVEPRLVRSTPQPEDLPHAFDQVPGALVRVCWCGKWPDHHVHTGDTDTCGCDECRASPDRARALTALLREIDSDAGDDRHRLDEIRAVAQDLARLHTGSQP